MDKKDFVVAFDLDGTVLDTNKLIFESFKYTFKHYLPEKELTEEELISFLGPSLHASFSRYFKESKVDEIIECYRKFNHENHEKYASVFPTVRKTLEYLKAHHYPLAIVTTKLKEVALIGLDLFNLTDYFDEVIGGDDVASEKPSPEGIDKVLKQFNTRKGVMVGDSVADILAGKNAKIMTIGVNYSLKKEQLENLNPDYMVNKMDDIIEIIKERNKQNG